MGTPESEALPSAPVLVSPESFPASLFGLPPVEPPSGLLGVPPDEAPPSGSAPTPPAPPLESEPPLPVSLPPVPPAAVASPPAPGVSSEKRCSESLDPHPRSTNAAQMDASRTTGSWERTGTNESSKPNGVYPPYGAFTLDRERIEVHVGRVRVVPYIDERPREKCTSVMPEPAAVRTLLALLAPSCALATDGQHSSTPPRRCHSTFARSIAASASAIVLHGSRDGERPARRCHAEYALAPAQQHAEEHATELAARAGDDPLPTFHWRCPRSPTGLRPCLSRPVSRYLPS
jgi:hypothetical protein